MKFHRPNQGVTGVSSRFGNVLDAAQFLFYGVCSIGHRICAEFPVQIIMKSYFLNTVPNRAKDLYGISYTCSFEFL